MAKADAAPAPEAVEPAVEAVGAVEGVAPAGEPAPAVEAEADAAPAGRKPKARREKFEATRPDGSVVIVDRNIDTGEQTVTEK